MIQPKRKNIECHIVFRIRIWRSCKPVPISTLRLASQVNGGIREKISNAIVINPSGIRQTHVTAGKNGWRATRALDGDGSPLKALVDRRRHGLARISRNARAQTDELAVEEEPGFQSAHAVARKFQRAYAKFAVRCARRQIQWCR